MRNIAVQVTAHTGTDRLARLPQSERGFGHVKLRNAVAAAFKRAELLAQLKAGPVAAVVPVAVTVAVAA